MLLRAGPDARPVPIAIGIVWLARTYYLDYLVICMLKQLLNLHIMFNQSDCLLILHHFSLVTSQFYKIDTCF